MQTSVYRVAGQLSLKESDGNVAPRKSSAMCNKLTDASQRISHGYSNTSWPALAARAAQQGRALSRFSDLLQGRIWPARTTGKSNGFFALQDAAHVDTGLPIHAPPRRVRLKCGRSRHAQLDSSKLSADDPQPSAYASNPRGNNRLLWKGWRANPIPEKNSVLIPVGSLPFQTRQIVKMANEWATANGVGGTTNIHRQKLSPTWSHRLHPNFIGGWQFHPKGRSELKERSVTEGAVHPIFVGLRGRADVPERPHGGYVPAAEVASPIF
jgi:hypothetical protein